MQFYNATDNYKEFSTDSAPQALTYVFSAGEFCIISLIMGVWLITLITFVHKWRHIRILQPREPRFKHVPKNLETIKVVERPTDSVIYKNYTRQISVNMQARQKKLDHMQRTQVQSKLRGRYHHSNKPRRSFVRSRLSASLTRPLMKFCEMNSLSYQSRDSKPHSNVTVFLTTAEESMEEGEICGDPSTISAPPSAFKNAKTNCQSETLHQLKSLSSFNGNGEKENPSCPTAIKDTS